MTDKELQRAIDIKKQIDGMEEFFALLQRYENSRITILLGNKNEPVADCRLFCDRSRTRIIKTLKDELEVTKHEFEKM